MRRLALASLLLIGCSGSDAPSDPVDADADGVPAGADCDDGDPFVYPGALERCNGVDDDCDGVVDGPEAAAPPHWYTDGDGDGFGAGEGLASCEPVAGRVQAGGDCDDDDRAVHPGARDGCDGVDSDCDGVVDSEPDAWGYLDADGDGFGAPDTYTTGCLGAGLAAVAGDCDDADPDAHPEGVEDCTPGDEDCDGFADDDDPEGAEGRTVYYADTDRDGFGDPLREAPRCAPPSDGVAEAAGDCDDADPEVHPGAFEACRGIDMDCDGLPPDDDAWYDRASPVRLTFTVEGVGDGVPLAVPVDAEALADHGVTDPTRVVAVVQDCAGAPRTLAAQWVDGLGDPYGPDDGGAGSWVHLVADTLDGAPLALYFAIDGPLPDAPVEAGDGWLAAGALEATFDPQRGGLVDDLRFDGALVASAADLDGSQGVVVDGAVAEVPGTVEVLATGPVVAAVRTVRADAGATLQHTWFAYAGQSGLQARVRAEAAADATVDAVRPLALAPWGLADGGQSMGLGAPLGAGLFGPPDLAVAWLVPPPDAEARCEPGRCELEGADRIGPVLAGSRLLDDRVFGVAVGPDAVDAVVGLPLERPTVTVGLLEDVP